MFANKSIEYKFNDVAPVRLYPSEKLKNKSCLMDRASHRAKLIVTASANMSRSRF